jgi:peptidoglycan/LPS O-acetylase OafA/YrhL
MGNKGLLLAFLIMYVGRFLKFTPFLEFAGSTAFFFKSIADTVMVTGFGIILLHVITQSSAFSKFLSGRVITWLGRISYSMYLWHSLMFILLAKILFPLKGSAQNVLPAFLLVSVCTILLSYFSYRYLELPYFKKRIRISSLTNCERDTKIKIDNQTLPVS